MPLTPKQERFVQEYLIDLNATQAAIRAGYSVKTARQVGTENLSKPVISDAIERARNARSERTEMTADWVLEQLREEATDRTEEASHSARVRALELIGKHLGMFVERIKVDGEISAVTEIVVRTREEAAALLPLVRERKPV